MKNFELTTLEKEVLKGALNEGYIYDSTYEEDAKSHFLCWGFSGKQERGAAASLVKKGVIEVFEEDGDTYVYLLMSRDEAEELCKQEVLEKKVIGKSNSKKAAKKVAQESLMKEYGFAPGLKNIILLESGYNGKYIDYLLFEVKGHEYCYLKNDTYEGVTKQEKR